MGPPTTEGERVMRKFLATLLALVALVFVAPPPANAAVWSRHENHPKVFDAGLLSDPIILGTLWFTSSQGDGDGSQVNGIQFKFTQNCGATESVGGRIVDIYISAYRTPGIYDIPLRTVHISNVYRCDAFKDFTLKGPDKGAMGVRMTAKVRIDGGIRDAHPVWEVCVSSTC